MPITRVVSLEAVQRASSMPAPMGLVCNLAALASGMCEHSPHALSCVELLEACREGRAQLSIGMVLYLQMVMNSGGVIVRCVDPGEEGGEFTVDVCNPNGGDEDQCRC
jgi:hypothetical protein